MGQPARKSATSKVDPGWVNHQGQIVHPDAPLGGGGPGRFRTLTTKDAEAKAPPSSLPSPRSAAARTVDPLRVQKAKTQAKKEAAKKTNAPPLVKTEYSKTIQGFTVIVKPDLHNVTGVIGAQTVLTHLSPKLSYEFNKTPGMVVVTSFSLSVTFVLQTMYGDGKPTDHSAYGRGTTQGDINNGDTTLGFHESCHRADYLGYLESKPPPAFKGKVGMKQEEFLKLLAAWNSALGEYEKQLKRDSVTHTDEVGEPTKTQFCKQHPYACPESN
jgi:hypothetical protein